MSLNRKLILILFTASLIGCDKYPSKIEALIACKEYTEDGGEYTKVRPKTDKELNEINFYKLWESEEKNVTERLNRRRMEMGGDNVCIVWEKNIEEGAQLNSYDKTPEERVVKRFYFD